MFYLQAVEKSSIRSRLDVSLRSPDTLDNIDTFAVACDFFSTLTGLLETCLHLVSD